MSLQTCKPQSTHAQLWHGIDQSSSFWAPSPHSWEPAGKMKGRVRRTGLEWNSAVLTIGLPGMKTTQLFTDALGNNQGPSHNHPTHSQQPHLSLSPSLSKASQQKTYIFSSRCFSLTFCLGRLWGGVFALFLWILRTGNRRRKQGI